jgi:D-tagatose-1,6-bisphosphate aldolase subunit GatZ/KbaZ
MDHLGPHVWSTQPADAAFNNAVALVRQCVNAGFRKLHFDITTGAPCNPGDTAAMKKAARQTADLCRVAEETAREISYENDMLYVIGTDVPEPGGGLRPEEGVAITDPQHLAQTLSVFQSAFASAGLERAWKKVVAVVVQPGVDFDDFSIADYDRRRAAALAAYHQYLPHGMTYEVHAADFQKPEALKKMVADRFNLLKIGPCVTFALRQALYALAHIEEALPDIDQPSHLRQTMEAMMIRDPLYWRSHYQGTPEQLAYMRHFGLRDRIRYYWALPQARKAVNQLLHNLNRSIPRALQEQYLPDLPADFLPAGKTMPPEAIINFRLHKILKPYRDAC